MGYKFGFIGVGHMGGALAGAVCRAGLGGDVVLCDHNRERLAAFASENSCSVGGAELTARESRYIFLGVKPQSMRSLFEEISPVLASRGDRFVLVTMAAGITMERLRAMAGGQYPTVRIMPNTPVAVGAGCTLFTSTGDVTAEERAELLAAMSGTGKFVELPEELIDAGCAVSGCGPAFVYKFIMALSAAGQSCGLSGDTALELAQNTVLGAAKLAIESGEEPEKLCRDVCSPGGSTIEGVKSLDGGGFASDVAEAVSASFNRTKELGQS